jgi:L,D-transpeptidase catalytic domain/Putative peptidoglycan binding domain
VVQSNVRLYGTRRRSRRRGRRLLAVLVVLAAAGLALAAGVIWWSGATLAQDSVALARVELQPLAGSLESAKAFQSNGKRIPIAASRGRLVPQTLLAPGEKVSVVVVVRRPGWLGWALGRDRTERLTLKTPEAHPTERWLTVPTGSPLRVRFTDHVAKIAYAHHVVAAHGARVVSLETQAPSGALEVATAARTWERLGPPVRVTWFPKAQLPVVLATPAPTGHIPPRTPIRLTFSQPLDKALGDEQPKFSSSVDGSWHPADSHTLVFTPSGYGFPFASRLQLKLPRAFAVSTRKKTTAARAIEWSVAGASFLRLQQLLAEDGYLPVSWAPARDPVPRELSAQLDAAVSPPDGTFSWRYPNTPPELQRLWAPGQPNDITRGAVMMFQDEHGLDVDGIVGPRVWHALLEDALAGKRRDDGYSYVYVHRNVPQLLTLWHNGTVVLTSPGNTGVPVAPTQLGTFPVFEHIPVGTMSGTNPDGSHYNDPGIRWISFFNGGDALHAFNRASFGTPQSLGCVELPLEAAAKVWPYTPIGTLVTIEN